MYIFHFCNSSSYVLHPCTKENQLANEIRSKEMIKTNEAIKVDELIEAEEDKGEEDKMNKEIKEARHRRSQQKCMK